MCHPTYSHMMIIEYINRHRSTHMHIQLAKDSRLFLTSVMMDCTIRSLMYVEKGSSLSSLTYSMSDSKYNKNQFIIIASMYYYLKDKPAIAMWNARFTSSWKCRSEVTYFHNTVVCMSLYYIFYNFRSKQKRSQYELPLANPHQYHLKTIFSKYQWTLNLPITLTDERDVTA